jgi:hypothetical protein
MIIVFRRILGILVTGCGLLVSILVLTLGMSIATMAIATTTLSPMSIPIIELGLFSRFSRYFS